MGHHFVPQRYLKGFQAKGDRPCYIWMYDKQSDKLNLLPIKQVAQAAGFYDDQVEKSLNADVEIPGYDVIDKICRGECIDDTGRMHLTYYIATMMRRVPRARRKANERVPEALDGTVQKFRTLFQQEFDAGRLDAETLAARLAEIDGVEDKFRKQTPARVMEVIETPWPFARWLIAISCMYWRVLKCAGPSYFLTSDNPASFFESDGLGNSECELILPLCSSVLLHCSWKSWKEKGTLPAQDRLVKELNRRTAVGAERFIFYHERAEWVRKVAQNRPEQRSRINWG